MGRISENENMKNSLHDWHVVHAERITRNHDIMRYQGCNEFAISIFPPTNAHRKIFSDLKLGLKQNVITMRIVDNPHADDKSNYIMGGILCSLFDASETDASIALHCFHTGESHECNNIVETLNRFTWDINMLYSTGTARMFQFVLKRVS